MKQFVTAFVLVACTVIVTACSKNETGRFVNHPDDTQSYDAPVGTSAKDLLSANPYTSLTVEIQYMQDYAPDAAALDLVKQFLANRLNKPQGIVIKTRPIEDAGASTLSLEQVKRIENNNRSVFHTGKDFSVYVLYTNSDYTDARTLGIAYRNTSTALFGRTIYENSGRIGQVSRTKLEATVLEHELGHLLGLVDLGTPMQTAHKDAAHGNHCDKSNCLMYYASETTDVLGFLTGGSIPGLDARCLSDLKANGGK